MFFGEPKTIIVVYKDELLINHLKKLIETNDDINDNNIIGTRDGSVRIVAWTEKIWNHQKESGNINNKILYLGNIKDVDKLIPIIDVKFNEFGIKYGWAGNQAVIISDSSALNKAEDYNAFLEKLNEYNLPEILKTKPRKINEVVEANTNFFGKVGKVFKKTTQSISTNVKNVIDSNNDKVKRQQYYYGIMKLYENHLEEFVQK